MTIINLINLNNLINLINLNSHVGFIVRMR